MRISEAWQDTGSKGSHIVTVSGDPPYTVPKTATSLVSLLATLNASGLSAFIISPDEPADKRPARLSLGMTGSDTADTIIREEVYAITRLQPDAGVSQTYRLERLLTLAWTLSSTAISINGTSLLECKSVTVVDDGLLEARTGKAAAAISREPASVEIFDTGDVAGILRVVKRASSSGAASAVPIHRRWE